VPGAAVLFAGDLTFMVAQGSSVVAQNSRQNLPALAGHGFVTDGFCGLPVSASGRDQRSHLPTGSFVRWSNLGTA
jgi:hypothetical protein